MKRQCWAALLVLLLSDVSFNATPASEIPNPVMGHSWGHPGSAGPRWAQPLAQDSSSHQSASSLAVVSANSVNEIVAHDWSDHTPQILIALMVVMVETILVTALVMSMRSRHRLMVQLRQEHADMELTVQKRTAELEKLNQRLAEISIREPLTGVYNRRYLDDIAVREFRRCRRASEPFSVAVLDVDYFKQYNDTYGHQMGDECLKQIAEKLTHCLHRPADVVARYGGDEFVAVMPNTDRVAAQLLATRMVEGISSLHVVHEASPVSGFVTVSLGLVSVERWTDKLQSVAQVLALADKQLYAAKEAGRNQFAALGVP